MTNTNLSRVTAERLRAKGYVNPAATQRRLRELRAQGVTMYRLGKHIGVRDTTLWAIYNGTAKYVHPDTAAVIAGLDPEQLQPQPPQMSRETLTALLDGQAVTIPPGAKPQYARALHARGWTESRIARTLRMSWTSTRNAITWEAA